MEAELAEQVQGTGELILRLFVLHPVSSSDGEHIQKSVLLAVD